MSRLKTTIVFVLICLILKVSADIKIFKSFKEHNAFQTNLILKNEEKTIRLIKFVDFDDFKHIKYWIFNVTHFEYRKGHLVVSFLPKKYIFLDRVTDLNNYRYFKIDRLLLYYYFVKGVLVDMLKFKNVNSQTFLIYIDFYNSKFLIYNRDRVLMDKNECKITVDSSKDDIYLNKYYVFKLGFGMKYSENTCKYIFANFYVQRVQIDRITNSFISRNVLGFIPQSPAVIRLNCTMRTVWLSFYKVTIDKNLLDEEVFGQTVLFTFRGEIDGLTVDLFKNIRYLRHIGLYLINLRKLFSKGIKWISSLNYDKNVNMSNEKELLKSVQDLKIIQTFYIDKDEASEKIKPYSYPDEDFCWFKDFPFNQMVFLDPQMYCVNNEVG